MLETPDHYSEAERRGDAAVDRRARVFLRRPLRFAQRAEERIERGRGGARRRQPMPGQQQIGSSRTEGLALVREQRKRQLGIVDRIVPPLPDQVAILVVLDESVVGVLRKGERTQHERVERRKFQQPKMRHRRAQVRQVEVDQVVAEHDIRALGEFVQFRQRTRERPCVQRLAGKRLAVGIDARQGTDRLRAAVDLEVDGQIAHQRSRRVSVAGVTIRRRLNETTADYPPIDCRMLRRRSPLRQ